MFFFGAVAVLHYSCHSGSDGGEPENLVPKEKFIPLLVDLKVLEEHFHRLYVRPEAYANSLDSSSAFIFQDYGVSKDEFRTSLNFYSGHPDTIYRIFESALDTINLRVTGMR